MIDKQDGKTSEGLHYQYWREHSQGSRPLLTLIMGYSGSIASWDTDFLDKLFTDVDLLLLDNRGTGYSFHPAQIDEITTAAMAQDTAALFQFLGIEQSFVLGYSLGGCIAQHLAALFPQHIQGLILLATTAGGSLYVPPEPGFLEKLQSPEGQTPWEMALSMWSLCTSARAIEQYREIFAAIHERQMLKPTPRRTFAGQMQAFRSFRAEDLFRPETLSFPISIISGKGDRLMPHGNSLRLHQFYTSSQLLELEDCEHLPYIEQKDTLLAALKTFLLHSHA